jgi:hypothetical protein
MSNAPTRIPGQYKNAPKAVKWFGITNTMMDSLFTAAKDVTNSYNIDNNEGEQLNIIGRVVVLTRDILQDITLTVTEFTSTSDTTKSEFGDSSAQCSTLEIQQDATASDVYYRKMLKAKIEKNNGYATYDDIIKAVLRLEPNNQVKIIDNQDMTFQLRFRDQPEQSTLDIINNSDLVPRPAGVEQILPPIIGF